MTEAGTSRSEHTETAAARGRSGDPPPRRPGLDRWKAIFVTLLVVTVLGAVTWVLLGSRLLVVREVEVTGTGLAPRDRVVAAAGIRLGLPMVRLGTADVRERVERLREVESAQVERHWPTRVRIVVRERVPIVVVERSGRYYQLDRHGVTVVDGATRPGGLPVLTAAAPGPSDPATLESLRVVSGLPGSLRGRLARVEVSGPDSVTLRLSDGLSVVWGTAERAEEKTRLIDALRRTAAGRGVRTIDVSSPEVVTTR